MKIKCNVCNSRTVIKIDREPHHSNDMICCPFCHKQIAYATEKKYSNKLIWGFLDTTYNKHLGLIPVEIIN